MVIPPNPTTVVAELMKTLGNTPYHICYQSGKFEEEIEGLMAKGFKLIIEPAKAVAFGGKRVAFLMQLGVGLLEIVEQ